MKTELEQDIQDYKTLIEDTKTALTEDVILEHEPCEDEQVKLLRIYEFLLKDLIR